MTSPGAGVALLTVFLDLLRSGLLSTVLVAHLVISARPVPSLIWAVFVNVSALVSGCETVTQKVNVTGWLLDTVPVHWMGSEVEMKCAPVEVVYVTDLTAEISSGRSS